MPIRLINKTQSVEISLPFEVSSANKTRPACFRASGLKGTESVTIQFRDSLGEWFDLMIDGDVAAMDEGNSYVCVFSPGVYRVHKSQTVNPVVVDVATDENP